MSDAAEVVKVEISKGGVMTVTLCDVENRNALGARLVGGIQDALAAANADPEVRVVVLTNEGNTFCAGANLKERSAANEAGREGKGDEDRCGRRTHGCSPGGGGAALLGETRGWSSGVAVLAKTLFFLIV